MEASEVIVWNLIKRRFQWRDHVLIVSPPVFVFVPPTNFSSSSSSLLFTVVLVRSVSVSATYRLFAFSPFSYACFVLDLYVKNNKSYFLYCFSKYRNNNTDNASSEPFVLSCRLAPSCGSWVDDHSQRRRRKFTVTKQPKTSRHRSFINDWKYTRTSFKTS